MDQFEHFPHHVKEVYRLFDLKHHVDLTKHLTWPLDAFRSELSNDYYLFIYLIVVVFYLQKYIVTVESPNALLTSKKWLTCRTCPDFRRKKSGRKPKSSVNFLKIFWKSVKFNTWLSSCISKVSIRWWEREFTVIIKARKRVSVWENM